MTVDDGTPVGPPAFGTDRFKDALSRFATGVTIVSGIDVDGGEPVGFTCQSFVSLSIDPPFVAVAPARTSTSWPRIARSGAFCVNVLSEDQEELCRGFAVSGGPKFEGVVWHPAPATGAPVIDGSLAWVDCRVELVHDAGDHELIVGRVLDLGVEAGSPLLFFRSRFATVSHDDRTSEG
ncbi:MAG TPA: flavin reductase family protein [Acidimicrobiales bacterium]|nr:flavin reductase family protein [Acidimicrobiales bacterium]